MTELVSGLVQSCEFLKKSWNFQQFSRPGKSLENGDKVWKNVKKSWVFFKTKVFYNKCFISEFFFHFGQILFNLVCKFLFFFKVSNIDNLESGKSLEFWIQKTKQTLLCLFYVIVFFFLTGCSLSYGSLFWLAFCRYVHRQPNLMLWEGV